MRNIDDDTIIAYDQYGQIVKAERLQKWAYNQLASAPDLLGACKEALANLSGHPEFWHRKANFRSIGRWLEEAIAKAEK